MVVLLSGKSAVGLFPGLVTALFCSRRLVLSVSSSDKLCVAGIDGLFIGLFLMGLGIVELARYTVAPLFTVVLILLCGLDVECRVSESPGVFVCLSMLVVAVWLICQSGVCFYLMYIGCLECGREV